jgi:hypothetical protein
VQFVFYLSGGNDSRKLAFGSTALEASIKQSAYVSIRQHTSAELEASVWVRRT